MTTTATPSTAIGLPKKSARRALIEANIQPRDVLGWTTREMKGALETMAPIKWRWFNLTSPPNAQTKLAKAERLGYRQGGVSFKSHEFEYEGETIVTCQWAHPGPGGCTEHCISYTGQNGLSQGQSAQVWRAQWLYEDPISFMAVLMDDIRKHHLLAAESGMTLVIRPDLNSNYQFWEAAPWMIDYQDHLAGMDGLARNWRETLELEKPMGADYDRSPRTPTVAVNQLTRWHLAHSLHAKKDGIQAIFDWHARGNHVSIVCSEPELLLDHVGAPFVDGDASDMWILNKEPVVGLLKPKVPMRPGHDSVYRAAEIYKHIKEM